MLRTRWNYTRVVHSCRSTSRVDSIRSMFHYVLLCGTANDCTCMKYFLSKICSQILSKILVLARDTVKAKKKLGSFFLLYTFSVFKYKGFFFQIRYIMICHIQPKIQNPLYLETKGVVQNLSMFATFITSSKPHSSTRHLSPHVNKSSSSCRPRTTARLTATATAQGRILQARHRHRPCLLPLHSVPLLLHLGRTAFAPLSVSTSSASGERQREERGEMKSERRTTLWSMYPFRGLGLTNNQYSASAVSTLLSS